MFRSLISKIQHLAETPQRQDRTAVTDQLRTKAIQSLCELYVKPGVTCEAIHNALYKVKSASHDSCAELTLCVAVGKILSGLCNPASAMPPSTEDVNHCLPVIKNARAAFLMAQDKPGYSIEMACRYIQLLFQALDERISRCSQPSKIERYESIRRQVEVHVVQDLGLAGVHQ